MCPFRKYSKLNDEARASVLTGFNVWILASGSASQTASIYVQSSPFDAETLNNLTYGDFITYCTCDRYTIIVEGLTDSLAKNQQQNIVAKYKNRRDY